MRDVCLIFEYDELIGTAEKYFMDACGFLEDSANQQEYLQEGLRVLAKCRESVRPAALFSRLDDAEFHDSVLTAGGMSFQCTAFEQIPDGNVLDVYGYLLTVGPCRIKDKNLSEQYYSDIWGEGFLESCRERIRAHVAELVRESMPGAYVTYSFGPGFYGMHPEKLWDLCQILDGEAIGLTVDENGIPSPEKSCGGFLFVVRDQAKLPSEICRDCIGSDEGCQFCGGRNRIPSREACLDLLRSYGTPDNVIVHCQTVTEVALRIGAKLKEQGLPIDLELLEGAALLHDIARTEENHSVKGAKIAIRHGYHKTGRLIKRHMFYICDPHHDTIDEQDILCLADRMVKEDRYVGLEARMQSVLEKFADDPEGRGRIQKRLEENQVLRDRIETIIGCTLQTLFAEGGGQ